MWTYSENGKEKLPEQVRTYYPIGGKKGKGNPKTTCMVGINGMMGEMGLMCEVERENWWHKMSIQIYRSKKMWKHCINCYK